jgi:hypothetical protein
VAATDRNGEKQAITSTKLSPSAIVTTLLRQPAAQTVMRPPSL